MIIEWTIIESLNLGLLSKPKKDCTIIKFTIFSIEFTFLSTLDVDPRTIIETYLTDLVSPALALSEARIQMSYNRSILSQPNFF